MNKKKLLALLAKKEERKKELGNKANTTEDIVELRSINTELEGLNGEITELRGIIDEMPDDEPTPPVPGQNPEQRGIIQPKGQFNPLGTYNFGGGAQVTPPKTGESRGLDSVLAIGDQMEMRSALFALPEYRSAYLKNLQGKRLDEMEQRALTTAANSGGAAVPSVTYDKIIEKLRQTSVLFPLIQATYIPGNVTLPVANALNSAVWSDEAEESNGSTGDDTASSVTLAGYTLAKYAKISAAAMVMTVDAFEAYIVDQIGQQLAIALENAILNGLGSSPAAPNKPQPTGILSGLTWDGTNSLSYTLANGLTYDNIVDTKAKLRTPYRPFARWILNSTVEAALEKIKDSMGRPIFSQSPQNGFEPRILNFPYIVDDYMPDNTILFGALNYYYMNFSQNAIIEASKEAGFTSASVIYRGVLIADGKPALSEAFVKLSGS